VPNFQKKKFLYRLSRADYEKSWGKNYQHAGFGTRLLALLLKIIPKVGPLKALDFNVPTPKTESMYFASINKTVDHYGALLGNAQKKSLQLPDNDLDSGKPTAAGEYSLADDTYAKMLSQLADKKFDATSPALQKNIVGFYSDPAASIEAKKHPDKWQKVKTDLDALKGFTPGPAQPAYPTPQPVASAPSGRR